MKLLASIAAASSDDKILLSSLSLKKYFLLMHQKYFSQMYQKKFSQMQKKVFLTDAARREKGKQSGAPEGISCN